MTRAPIRHAIRTQPIAENRREVRHKATKGASVKLNTIRKALMAAATAAIAAAVTAYPDGFTDKELAAIAGAALVAGLAVFRIPNEPKDGAR